MSKILKSVLTLECPQGSLHAHLSRLSTLFISSMSRKKNQLSELTFEVIIESTPNAIVLVDSSGEIVFVNSQTEDLFGYKREELIGQKVEVLIPERFKKHHPAYRNSFNDNPEVRAMGLGRDLFAVGKDGGEFPIEIGLNPVKTDKGTLILASIIDITARKRAEERFRKVVESAPYAMILVNPKGQIAMVNKQTESLFGYEREELVGQRMEILMPERYRKNHRGYREGFQENPKQRTMGSGRDLFALRKDGSEVQVEIGLNPIETEEGQMTLASIIDITYRKAQEFTIVNQLNELELKNKELEQFTYIASHDLQEPLRTVSNFIQIIEEDISDELRGEIELYLEKIKNATVRMRELVRALLAFSRLGRDVKFQKMDLQKVMTYVVQDLDDLIQRNKAEIRIPRLGSISGSELELRQLFQNLLTNAIKFRRPDVPPIVELKVSEFPSYYQFEVKDNGIGIEETYYDRVFHIFQRLNHDSDYEGHGIGLAFCKKIVELHRGSIWILSEKGVGTSIYFTLNKNLPVN